MQTESHALEHEITNIVNQIEQLSQQLTHLKQTLKQKSVQNHPYLESQGIYPYGEAAEKILSDVHKDILKKQHDIGCYFYDHIDTDGKIVLSFLTQDEQEHLLTKQMEYLETVTGPTLTIEQHKKMADIAGERHNMVSLSANSLIESYQTYETAITTFLPELNHQLLLAHLIIQQRLAQDMAWQLASYIQSNDKRKVTLSNLTQSLENITTREDIEEITLQHILEFDGIHGASFAHIDYQNQFLIEKNLGHILFHDAPLEQLGTEQHEQLSLLHAWNHQSPILCNNLAEVETLVPCLAESVRQNGQTRSFAIFPLDETPEGTLTFLILYSPWPGFFYGHAKTLLLGHLTQLIKTELTNSSRLINAKNLKVLNQDEKMHIKSLLIQKRVEMVFQPIVEHDSGRLIKVEALARLKNDNGTFYTPWAFLAAFGARDLQTLYEQGLQQVCDLLNELKQRGHSTIMANINLPPELFYQKDLIQKTVALVESNQISPSQITLEVLESSIADATFAANIIQQFVDCGFQVVLDDVGSESSSMVRMKELKIHGIKIDQDFIRPLFDNLDNLPYILSLIMLAENLNIQCTIEGVETPALCRTLGTLGATQLQGYGIAKPLAKPDLFKWIEHNLNKPAEQACCPEHLEMEAHNWICHWYIQLYHHNLILNNALPNYLTSINFEILTRNIQQDYQDILQARNIQNSSLETCYQRYIEQLSLLKACQQQNRSTKSCAKFNLSALKHQLNHIIKEIQDLIEQDANKNTG